MSNESTLEHIGNEYTRRCTQWYRPLLDAMPEDEAVELASFIGAGAGAVLSHFILNTQADVGAEVCDLAIATEIYARFGLKPHGLVMPDAWTMWVEGAKADHDQLLMRLIEDGFNPDRRMPGYHSAGNYVEKNRANLPRTWAWFCQRELKKKARKRSWASGALVEPRAL